jgi:hypothetical protein
MSPVVDDDLRYQLYRALSRGSRPQLLVYIPEWTSKPDVVSTFTRVTADYTYCPQRT